MAQDAVDGDDALRVGDGDREAAVDALSEHLGAGRLDVEEFGDRSARVTAARTRGELTAAFVDLPAPRPEFTVPATPRPREPEPDTAGPDPAQRDQGDQGGQNQALAQALPYLLPIAVIAAVVAMFIWAPGIAWLVLIFGAPLVFTQLNRLRGRAEERQTEPPQQDPAAEDWDMLAYPAPDPSQRVDLDTRPEPAPAPEPSREPTGDPDDEPDKNVDENGEPSRDAGAK